MKVRDLVFRQDSPYTGFETNPAEVDLQGWDSEHSVFETHIRSLRPSTIIEVGTWKGGSAVNMATLAQSLGLDTEVVCVDTWLGNWQHWARDTGAGSVADLKLRNGFPQLYYTFLNNVSCRGLQDSITPLPLPAYSAFKFLAHQNVKAQIIYIDGDHEYDAVHLDIRCYWQLLADDGVLICDDIRWPGVRQAVRELFEENESAVHKSVNKAWMYKRDFPKLDARLAKG